MARGKGKYTAIQNLRQRLKGNEHSIFINSIQRVNTVKPFNEKLTGELTIVKAGTATTYSYNALWDYDTESYTFYFKGGHIVIPKTGTNTMKLDNVDEFNVISSSLTSTDNQVFTPTFSKDYSKGCGTDPSVSGNSATFGPGRIRSNETYKNISKVTATVDLSGLTDSKWVNASFYLVNGSDDYCDSGNAGSPFCDEIDFLETNGNAVTQTTIHLSNIQNYQYATTSGINTVSDCWNDVEGENGVIDATLIDVSQPFTIEAVFDIDDGEYTNMTVTYIQDDNSVIVYDFANNTAGDGSGSVDLSSLASGMEAGWKVVASLWQGYSPNPGNTYNYSDSSCSGWSDLCSTSFIISDIEVTAESTV